MKKVWLKNASKQKTKNKRKFNNFLAKQMFFKTHYRFDRILILFFVPAVNFTGLHTVGNNNQKT